jgi:2-amino-4-hydroxy-6-hydroxymethyldihydropteridine diphosphokinase
MPRCHIALGGNLGPVAETFRAALARLADAGCDVRAVSRLYRTSPIGCSGGDFLNAAASIDTALSAEGLLVRLQAIEDELGRKRGPHWGPRTIDLDLLFYGDAVIETPRLTVPHPHCWFRRFVLDPLAEYAAGFVHPVKRATIGDLREQLLRRPLPVAIAGGTGEMQRDLTRSLSSEFAQVRFSNWPDDTGESSSSKAEPALLFWLGPVLPTKIDQADDDAWRKLPLRPRISVPASADPPAEFVRYVLSAALGEVEICSEP